MANNIVDTGQRTLRSSPVHLESIHPDVQVPVTLSSGASISTDVPPGVKSTGNSTNTPLSAGASWTGEWENIAAYPAITINGGSDVPGTLYAEFNSVAASGGDVHRIVQLSSGLLGAFGIHALARVDTYFRVRVVNGSTEQTSMEIETYLSPTAVIAQPTSRAAQTINDYSDVLNVRQLSDPRLDEANSKQADRSVVQKFGANPAVGAGTTEDIWNGGGLYTGFLQAAIAVRVKSGGHANDTDGGSGAQSVIVVGLNQNWEDAAEIITLAGASQSSATVTTFIRVYRAYIVDVGTYGGANTGDITIETTGGVVVAVVAAELGQTQMCIYTVPASKTAFIRRLGVTVEANKATTVHYFQRQNADDVVTPYTGKRLVFSFAGLTGSASEMFGAYIGPFPAKTDIWAQATGPTGGATISATMDIVLVTA